MAFTRIKHLAASSGKAAVFLLLSAVFILPSCKKGEKIYESTCDKGIAFKRVSFSRLIDSIEVYDQKYVEVEGTYEEGKEESEMVNDSLFADHSNQRALWINFSQDCPLYLRGTHIGLFEYNDGKFTQINNKTITIRGKVDVRHKGHLGSYRGTIDRVSYVKM